MKTSVSRLDKAGAHRRAQRVRDGVMAVNELIETLVEIQERQDWLALGYKNWPEYYEGEFGPNRLKLTAEQRGQVVAVLVASGMSKRKVAKALGFDEKTVRNDLRGAEKSALPSGEPQVSGDRDSGSAGDHTQTASEPPAGNGLASPEPVPGNPLDPPSRDHEVDESQALPSSSPGSGPSTPADLSLDQVALVADQPGLDSPLARGETGTLAPVAAEEPTSPGDSSAAQNLTEEQAPTPPGMPVLSPPEPFGVEPGGEVEEEPLGQAGSSSTDPTFMDAIDAMWSALDRLDVDAQAPMLLGEEMTRIEQIGPVLTHVAAQLRQRREP